jgi:hypothetical protein
MLPTARDGLPNFRFEAQPCCECAQRCMSLMVHQDTVLPTARTRSSRCLSAEVLGTVPRLYR